MPRTKFAVSLFQERANLLPFAIPVSGRVCLERYGKTWEGLWLKTQINYEVLGDLGRLREVEGADRRSIPSYRGERENRDAGHPVPEKQRTGAAERWLNGNRIV